MSIKTEISSIRRDIQNRKITPRSALNGVNKIISETFYKIPDDSIGAFVYDLWKEWHELLQSPSIKNDNYGHQQFAFDAKIQIIGDLTSKLEKSIKERDKMIDIKSITDIIADDKLVEGCGLDICDGERLDDFISRSYHQKDAINQYRKKLLDKLKNCVDIPNPV